MPSSIKPHREFTSQIFLGKDSRQDRRRSDKYELTTENTNNPNTAKPRNITITGIPSKHPLYLATHGPLSISSFSTTYHAPSHSSVTIARHTCHPTPTLCTPVLALSSHYPLTPQLKKSITIRLPIPLFLCDLCAPTSAISVLSPLFHPQKQKRHSRNRAAPALPVI